MTRFLAAETPTETPGSKETERGERGLSFGYRIVENVRREEEIRAKNKKKGSKRIETADLLRSVFQLKKRLKKRLIVGKSERAERELSVDYKIVDNERQEEKMCDPRSHGRTSHSTRAACSISI